MCLGMRKISIIIGCVSELSRLALEELQANESADEPEKYANAPVSIQLVGRRYEDEKVIEAMEYIKEKVGLPFVDFV